MLDLITKNVLMGFVLSMIVFFHGQALRIFSETIEYLTTRR